VTSRAELKRLRRARIDASLSALADLYEADGQLLLTMDPATLFERVADELRRHRANAMIMLDGRLRHTEKGVSDV
jgi:hypothetical protein